VAGQRWLSGGGCGGPQVARRWRPGGGGWSTVVGRQARWHWSATGEAEPGGWPRSRWQPSKRQGGDGASGKEAAAV
jgi:hypothetical protein